MNYPWIGVASCSDFCLYCFFVSSNSIDWRFFAFFCSVCFGVCLNRSYDMTCQIAAIDLAFLLPRFISRGANVTAGILRFLQLVFRNILLCQTFAGYLGVLCCCGS